MADTTQDFSVGPGKKAPQTTFTDTSGRTLKLKDLLASSGSLPVLLAFFKVSCPTCQLTWPYLQRVNQLYGGKGVRVFGVCQNDAGAAKHFYGEFGGATFDALVDRAPAFVASNAFGVVAVPHLALVSQDGTVRQVFAGWSRKEMEELGRSVASAAGLPVRPVVPPDDPVKDFQAG
jgi:peroxiredoxin